MTERVLDSTRCRQDRPATSAAAKPEQCTCSLTQEALEQKAKISIGQLCPECDHKFGEHPSASASSASSSSAAGIPYAKEINAAQAAKEGKRKRVEELQNELTKAGTPDEKKLKQDELAGMKDDLQQANRQVSTLLDLQDVAVQKLKQEAGILAQSSSWTVLVSGELLEDAVVWKTEVEDKNIPRTIVKFDELLAPNRPLITELRWLQLKLVASGEHGRMDAIVQMRAKRKNETKGKHDLEVPYHPLLLLFYQAASAGQEGVQFLAEDHNLEQPGEDIRGMIGDKRLEPQECKSECVYNPSATEDPAAGIDANRAALGKLLKVGD